MTKKPKNTRLDPGIVLTHLADAPLNGSDEDHLAALDDPDYLAEHRRDMSHLSDEEFEKQLAEMRYSLRFALGLVDNDEEEDDDDE